MKIDLNCDMGEGVGSPETDREIMRSISSVNIACGAHAGDADEMLRCTQMAIDCGVAIGAHPGFADREGFGRTFINLTNSELQASLYKQIETLKLIVESAGGRLRHVKPHGAMYNHAAVNYDYSVLIARVIKDIDPELIFVGLSGSSMKDAAENVGLQFANEVFADRRYTADGLLVPRSEPGAVIHNEDESFEQVRQMIVHGKLQSIDKQVIAINPQTLCVHGDTPDSLLFVKNICRYLQIQNIAIQAIDNRPL